MSVSAQHYVDGAVSDNLPRCQQKNTITISAYAGESDICPRGSVLSFHRVRFNNVSIQVNSENMYRVMSTFFPPEPQVSQAPPLCASCRYQVSALNVKHMKPRLPSMLTWRLHEEVMNRLVCVLIRPLRILQAMAEICQNGYADALRFLQENRESWCSREGTCLLQRTSCDSHL